MHPSEMRGANGLRNDFGMRWGRFVEFITNGLPPADLGVLEAHWIAMGTTDDIREALEGARRRRRGILARLSSWRRSYLDGLAWSLDTELQRRSRESEASRRARL